MFTNTRKTFIHLNDLKSDILYAIENEDSAINVSQRDVRVIEEVKSTIRSLEQDYETLYNKISSVIYKRMDEIGRENAENDFIIQVLHAIQISEKERGGISGEH